MRAGASWALWTLGMCALGFGALYGLDELVHPVAGYEGPQWLALIGIGLVVAQPDIAGTGLNEQRPSR